MGLWMATLMVFCLDFDLDHLMDLSLEKNEGAEIVFPDRKATCDGTDLGLSECSNDGNAVGKFEGLFLGAWLV